MAKTYIGFRGPSGPQVLVDGWPLPLRLDLRNHSPTGFEWGYGGSGPSQLALAIMADFFGDDQKALGVYQDFKWDFLAGRTEDDWTITGDQVAAWLKAREGEAAAPPE